MAVDGLPATMLERIRRHRVLEADRQEATAGFAIRSFFEGPDGGRIGAAPKSLSEAMSAAGVPTAGPVRSRQVAGEGLLPPPCSAFDLDWAAEAIGFPLPATVQQLFLEVGNGGFGPGNSAFGLERLVAEYQDMIAEPIGFGGFPWPPMLLPIADLDPGFTCLDVQTGRIIDWAPAGLDDGEDDWEGSFTEAAPDLFHWLNAWLDQPR